MRAQTHEYRTVKARGTINHKRNISCFIQLIRQLQQHYAIPLNITPAYKDIQNSMHNDKAASSSTNSNGRHQTTTALSYLQHTNKTMHSGPKYITPPNANIITQVKIPRIIQLRHLKN